MVIALPLKYIVSVPLVFVLSYSIYIYIQISLFLFFSNLLQVTNSSHRIFANEGYINQFKFVLWNLELKSWFCRTYFILKSITIIINNWNICFFLDLITNTYKNANSHLIQNMLVYHLLPSHLPLILLDEIKIHFILYLM